VTDEGELGKPSKKRKIKTFFADIRVNWHSSTKEGEYLGYKEMFSYSLAGGGVGGIGNLAIFTALGTATILIGSIYKITPTLLYIMGIAFTLFTLIKNPILSMIMDNTKSKKGKFKPYLIWMGIPSIILFCLTPYVPLKWMDIILFSVFNEPVPLAALVLFIINFLLSITWPIVNVAFAGLGQVLTPNTLERSKMFAIHPLISSFWPSIIGVTFPLLSILTKRGEITGQESILSYQVFMPIFGILSFLLLMLAYVNVNERIVVEKEYKPKVKFWRGVKNLSSNKYFWIIVFSQATNTRWNIVPWILIYSLKSDVITSVATILLGNVMIPGFLLSAWLTRKIGKRNIMLLVGFISSALYIPMAIFPNRPYLLLGMVAIQNMFGGLGTCQAVMPADALDFQQLKTGERLESFWGMFNQLVLAITGLGIGLLFPFVSRISGMPVGADVLAQDVIRHTVFRNFSIVGAIGALVSTLPYLLWDLSEEKHKDIIKQLKIIAEEKNKLNTSMKLD